MATSAKPLHIRLAAPCFASRLPAAFFCCIKLCRDACAQAGVNLSLDLIGNESLVQRARNVLVERFLRSDADKLFFVDSDISFTPEDFLRIARNPKDVVVGAYAKKDIRWDDVTNGVLQGSAEPPHSMGLNYNINVRPGTGVDEDGTFPVLDGATGFMCLSRAVLQRLCDHFRDELLVNNDLPQNGPSSEHIDQYVAIFDCMIDPDTRRYLSEDYALCRRLQQMNEQVWLDYRTTLCHDGNVDFRGDVRAAWETLRAQQERLGTSSPEATAQAARGAPTAAKPPRAPKPISGGGRAAAGAAPMAVTEITEIADPEAE